MESEPPAPKAPPPQEEAQEEDEEAEEGDDDEESDGERTVILDRLSPPPEQPSPSPLAQSTTPQETPTHAQLSASHSRHSSDADASQTPAAEGHGAKRSKVKHTADAERIVAKVWATVGDLLMPGHTFNVSGADASRRPPRAKETMYAFLICRSYIRID